MIRDPWIRESGICEENEVQKILKDMSDYTFFMALLTDGFICAEIAESPQILSAINLHHLLELRAFGENSELWLHRTMLKEAFSWRIADDEYLEEKIVSEGNGFFSQAQNYRMENCQLIDMDRTYKPNEIPAYGGTCLKTVGGGTYELPIHQGENAVCFVSYLNYDNDGIAVIADYRMKGFGIMKGADES